MVFVILASIFSLIAIIYLALTAAAIHEIKNGKIPSITILDAVFGFAIAFAVLFGILLIYGIIILVKSHKTVPSVTVSAPTQPTKTVDSVPTSDYGNSIQQTVSYDNRSGQLLTGGNSLIDNTGPSLSG